MYVNLSSLLFIILACLCASSLASLEVGSSVNGNFLNSFEVEAFEASLPTTGDDETIERSATTQEVVELIKRLPIRYALMKKNGPEQIKTYLDDPFDPQEHEALTSEEREGVSEPTVASVYQPGYRHGGRVLRPARVAVAGA